MTLLRSTAKVFCSFFTLAISFAASKPPVSKGLNWNRPTHEQVKPFLKIVTTKRSVKMRVINKKDCKKELNNQDKKRREYEKKITINFRKTMDAVQADTNNKACGKDRLERKKSRVELSPRDCEREKEYGRSEQLEKLRDGCGVKGGRQREVITCLTIRGKR